MRCRVQQARHVGAEFLDRGEIAREPERRVNRAITQQKWQNRNRGSNPRNADGKKLPASRPRAREPHDPETHEDTEKQQVVPVAETLKTPPRREKGEPSRSRVPKIPVQPEKREWHRERGERLNLGQVRNAV